MNTPSQSFEYPWDQSPEWAMWAATDADGAQWWFAKEPRPVMDVWDIDEVGGRAKLCFARIVGRNACPTWRDSLRARPVGGVEGGRVPQRMLWDSQWVNIVNHDNCYAGYAVDDAVACAVKKAEDYIRSNIERGELPVDVRPTPPQVEPVSGGEAVAIKAEIVRLLGLITEAAHASDHAFDDWGEDDGECVTVSDREAIDAVNAAFEALDQVDEPPNADDIEHRHGCHRAQLHIIALLDRLAVAKAPAYCRACQDVGMSNCQHFDECSGATCSTCHRPLNVVATHPAPVCDRVAGEGEIEALRKDAERYRFLRSEAYLAVIPHGNKLNGSRTAWITKFHVGQTFDTAIDAAIDAAIASTLAPTALNGGE